MKTVDKSDQLELTLNKTDKQSKTQRKNKGEITTLLSPLQNKAKKEENISYSFDMIYHFNKYINYIYCYFIILSFQG